MSLCVSWFLWYGMNLCVIVAAYSLRCLHIIACAVLYVFMWSWFLWYEMYLCVIVAAYSLRCLPKTVCHNVFGISSEPVGWCLRLRTVFVQCMAGSLRVCIKLSGPDVDIYLLWNGCHGYLLSNIHCAWSMLWLQCLVEALTEELEECLLKLKATLHRHSGASPLLAKLVAPFRFPMVSHLQ